MTLVEAGPQLDLGPQELRIVDAALRCIARWGVAKTTLDDVAREAACSRATVYRVLPGGKDGLIDTVSRVEMARFWTQLHDRLRAAATLEDLLVTGIAEAGRSIAGHGAVQFLLAHEPEIILPRLAFHQFDNVLTAAAAFAAPYLERWLDPLDARRAAEWVVRIVVSYTLCPADGVDMGDEASVRDLVRAFVLPGLESQMVCT